MSGNYSVSAKPRNPTVTNITMTLADTQYTHQLTKYTKNFMIHTRDESSFRLAFATGIVAVPAGDYLTVPVNARYYEENINVYVANADWDGTLYFASDSAGKIIEVVEWV